MEHYSDCEFFVAGIGLFFSALMIGITALQARYTSFSPKSAEEFSSASRSIKPGLIAAGIVSAWTTAATFVSMMFVFVRFNLGRLSLQLQSSAVAYKYGMC
jgi:urea-proton symporter